MPARKLGPPLIAVWASASAHAGTLYATDFEEFPAGDNRWGGHEGWISSDTSSGAQGIVQDPVGDLPLGRTAYLGFEPPSAALTTIYRPINHDPASGGMARIEFESLLGVQDSTNGRRDRFYLSFYNIDGGFLGALIFDNISGNVLSDDGSTVFDTGVSFLRGDPVSGLAALQILRIAVDLDTNHWSANLDSIPLFDRPFTATGQPLTLGTIAVEWEVPSGNPANAGNNWLLVADWLVASIPAGPFSVVSIERDSDGTTTLTWPGHPGFDYQVLYSPDLQSWSDDLPGAATTGNPIEGHLSYTDSSVAQTGRYYKVIRSPSR